MSGQSFKISDKYQYIILDLDNTLYDEKRYLYPAYKKIAEWLEQNYKVSKATIEKYLISEFEKSDRKNLFNKLCAQFNIPKTAMDEMLKILRTVQLPAKIELFDEMKILIDTLLKEKRTLFVITNGNLQQQENKVSSINWQGRDKHIQFVFAANHKPKPDTAAFDYLAGNFSVITHKTLYIGDTDIDTQFAQNCGINFLNVEEILNPATK